MKRITRAATLDDLRDLLDRPPRAYLAFNDGDAAMAAPVTCRFDNARHLVRLDESAGARPAPGDSAMLLVDDGHYSLQLRGFRIRGRLAEVAEPVPPSAAGKGWMELLPEKVICWDYGTVRQERSR
jgi:hypothetical protein